MKILYGFYRADAGEIRIVGQAVRIRSPHDARRLRINGKARVFQGPIRDNKGVELVKAGEGFRSAISGGWTGSWRA